MTVNPLLKWPGGKGREFEAVRSLIPPAAAYVEPFLGGGAFFFRLSPPCAYLGDVNQRLISLYRHVQLQTPAFRQAMDQYVSSWEYLGILVRAVQQPLITLYATCREHESVDMLLRDQAARLLREHEAAFQQDWHAFFGDTAKLWKCITASLMSKLARLPKLERDNAIEFGASLMRDHVETAVRAGFYTYIRDDWTPRQEPEEVAQFYFLREFCYGAMFRFNKAGRFNIPYGGIAYNAKDFRGKAARLFAPQTQSLFERAHLLNLDFRAFFQTVGPRLTPNDFCFLDPPYDTEFSAYDNHAFTPDDQADLARIFTSLPCRAMLIIKDSPLIRELYTGLQRNNPRITLTQYEKTYAYNVRGRNARDVQHLLVCNYAPPERIIVRSAVTPSLFGTNL